MGGEGLPTRRGDGDAMACFLFPAGTTTRAAAAVGCRYEQMSQAEDGEEAGWKT